MSAVIRFAALVAGISYLWCVVHALDGSLAIAWKGSGVALLAVWAALNARTADGWLIAAVMAFGALGDVLLETSGQTAGAAAFIGGHIVAIVLYLRNRRPHISFSQRLLAALTVPLSVFVATQIVPSSEMVAVGAYSLFVAGMAASAWISRFPRYQTGTGAMLFLLSDLLIFARMGPLASVGAVSVAIWALYFGGQFLIVNGVMANQRHALR